MFFVSLPFCSCVGTQGCRLACPAGKGRDVTGLRNHLPAQGRISHSEVIPTAFLLNAHPLSRVPQAQSRSAGK